MQSGVWHSKGQNDDGKVGEFRLVETEVVLTCKKEKRAEQWNSGRVEQSVSEQSPSDFTLIEGIE